jgi:uncharacterized protein (DUF362 family)
VVVDGIVGGDGNGPMAPDPKRCGIVIAGTHPVAVDCVAAALMGFAWEKIALLKNAFRIKALEFTSFGPEDVEIISNRPEWTGRLAELAEEDVFHFRPHFGWTGAIERKKSALPTHA